MFKDFAYKINIGIKHRQQQMLNADRVAAQLLCLYRADADNLIHFIGESPLTHIFTFICY
jgi:hypothetical protein